MSDILYNHFRPVEANIPIEDRTQFLHFGQKLPQTTATEATAATTKRRYPLKRSDDSIQVTKQSAVTSPSRIQSRSDTTIMTNVIQDQESPNSTMEDVTLEPKSTNILSSGSTEPQVWFGFL